MEPPQKKIPEEEISEMERHQILEARKISNNRPSPLIFLPKELWTLIFNYVPQEDRLKQRVINKDWCKNIDEFSTVDVSFNEDYPPKRHKNRVFELRIRSCTFSSLHEPFAPSFKNPFLVKEITFTTHVSASNVLKILSVCSKVESLRFLATMTSETYFEDEDRKKTAAVFNNLKNLQYLEIGILTFLDRNAREKSQTFSAIIGNDDVSFPALRTLSIAFLVRHIEWCQIFKFICRHSVTLKSLNTICPCGERLIGREQRPRDTIVPTDLVYPQLTSLVVNGASECPCREDVKLLLDQQKQLRRFESDISQGACLLRNVIESNESTIRILKLHEIGNFYSDELNCNIFERCISLQELSLRLDWRFVLVVNVEGGTAQQRMPALHNLEALPQSLKRLTLCGSQIPSQELESLFAKERVLEEFTLGRADSLKMNGTGMTIGILLAMLGKMKKLKKFRIFLDMISGLESQEVYYCNQLKGLWLQIWEVAKEINGTGTGDFDASGEMCCGERYSDTHCLGHRPFIDMVFSTGPVREQFINQIKELKIES